MVESADDKNDMIFEIWVQLNMAVGKMLMYPIDKIAESCGITMTADVVEGIDLLADYFVYLVSLLGDPAIWFLGFTVDMITVATSFIIIRLVMWLFRLPFRLLRYLLGFAMRRI